MLRCLAGLHKTANGYLRVKGEIWQSEKVFLKTHRRSLAYVFQEASLFPHLTAEDNLNFAIKRSGHKKDQGSYEALVELLALSELLQRYPEQLSGGERQRVALARALLCQPKLVLMDEPLSALDERRKQEVLPYLERLHHEISLPVVYVSHSVDELARIADTVLVMDQGRCVAQDSVAEIFSRAELFLGANENISSLLCGTVREKDEDNRVYLVELDGHTIWVPFDSIQRKRGEKIRVRVFARDVSIALAAHDDSSILNKLEATIESLRPDKNASIYTAELRAGSAVLFSRLTYRSVRQMGLFQGQKVWAQMKSASLVP